MPGSDLKQIAETLARELGGDESASWEYWAAPKIASALRTVQQEARAWRPIETAPEQQDVDVLLDGPLGIGVGHWEPAVPQEDELGCPADPIPAGWWGERGYWPAEADARPTHWMPLPPSDRRRADPPDPPGEAVEP